LTGGLLRSFIIGFVAAVTASAPAAALTYADILGGWCGVRSNPNRTNYTFTRKTLTVTFLPGRTKKVFKVDNYDFSDTGTVTLFYWQARDERRQVHFGDFSSDGREMFQQSSEAGGLYRFVRC
jgi:hypothetical protein